MRRKLCSITAVLGLLFAPVVTLAQDAVKKDDSRKQEATYRGVTALRVQIVFEEFDGEKKVGNLPYSLMINADEHGRPAALRMGLRVPIATGSEKKEFTYMDVGTNIDGMASALDDGRFSVQLNVERSTIYGLENGKKLPIYESSHVSDATPIVVQFRSQINLLLRDGQSMQTTVATDPLTGRVEKVEVTLNVLKRA